MYRAPRASVAGIAGYLKLAQTARRANARIQAARVLETRWKALGPEQQEQARAEWDRLRAAVAAARARLEAGPRGFARELRAAYRGQEPEPAPDPRPLTEIALELHRASAAMRAKLDSLE